MITFDELVASGVVFLESNRHCSKHHVEHTGSNAYLLDFYTAQGAVEKGKDFIRYLMTLIVLDRSSFVFYPGRLNQMNMSNNVIDTGATVDSVARFLRIHHDAFTPEEHHNYGTLLAKVVDTYLLPAALEKPITNQRLWGLTGIASFARYRGEEARFRPHIVASIERAFLDMTPDGFFRYYPNASQYAAFEGYDGISAFYQSRHIAFIEYALSETGMSREPYTDRLDRAMRSLLSMYTSKGWKDMRLECKRWYWQSPYEVASHGFDAYALATHPMASTDTALSNILFQIRNNFSSGHLLSHKGLPINFQCSIFWTAHLAWMLRVSQSSQRFNEAKEVIPFSYEFRGVEVYAKTSSKSRVLINARFQSRNPTVGIYDNGLPPKVVWSLKFPHLPPAFGMSVREVLNHTWYALRGGYVFEALFRVIRFSGELVVMLLPRYSSTYGRIESMHYNEKESTIEVIVFFGTKYGTVLPFSERLLVHIHD